MEIYLVGGAVRDPLLGNPIKERDYVVVGATPEQMLAKGFRLVGKDFPVFLHPKTHEEYALARTERKTGPGYKGFSCYAAPDVTLEADLKRRDLTINAIAQTTTGEIIDPYHGQEDIANRVFRHISPAFIEDPVRILRVARFMASFAHLGFHVAPETMQLMKTMVKAGEVNALVPERVWQEFSLALTKPTPQAFIKTLFDCGALAILFPALQMLYTNFIIASDQQDKKRTNNLATFDCAIKLSSDPQVRFAALLCHLGRELPGKTNETGMLSIQHLCKSYRIPTSYSSLAIITARYHLLAHRALELDAETLLNLLEKTDAFRQLARFQQFLLVCEADFHAYAGLNSNPYLQKNRILAALSTAKSISVAALIKQGLEGQILGKKLRQQRIEALSHLIHSS
ncbi:multifunctional CCA addition/repair protein [Rickettsiella endosymbiont of Dermanyssus gallinae]|uniref:multifunctional CCA addition/repair protein n=1 Tax=Rickettsiella endosymbiont of Dermanyssus gallinae TaxID=2856608 RepID=UPI001C5326F8|nr:multifunctional CCA addition/repair protein [Rickettsiella endosymbiont of Dermanyssus gallinae]